MKYSVQNDRLKKDGRSVRFVESPNTYSQKSKYHISKHKFLVIHYTVSGSADIAEYFSHRSANVSAHLVIRRDGKVAQCVPFDVRGWHAGKSEWYANDGKHYEGLNAHSIGIELENWGPLKKAGNRWISVSSQTIPNNNVFEGLHRNGSIYKAWEIFTQKQIKATIGVAKAICKEYGITEILGHDDISPGRKIDPGPALDMDYIRGRVLGRGSSGPLVFAVTASRLNIRVGPGAHHEKAGPALKRNTKLVAHEVNGRWRYVSVLNSAGNPNLSGWVHGGYIREL